MITVCPVCSRSVVAHWPEFWPYRRGEAYYCSQNCYDISLTRDLNMLHDAARRRRGLKMARMKKDGMPAKRPGPKAKTIIETPECGFMEVEIPEKVPTVKLDGALRIETPEAGKVDVVEKHERSDFYNKIDNKLKIALLSDVLSDFDVQYRRFDDNMTLFADGIDQPLEMSRAEWIQFTKEILTALDQLGVSQ